MWKEEQVPSEWWKGYLVKLPKKGDSASQCSLYRRITLLSILGKAFSQVLLNRMKNAVDAQLRDQQAGFRKDMSFTDQIATLCLMLEQSSEWNSSLYVSFIDHEKVINSLGRQSLWKLPRHYDVPEKINSIIRNSYKGMEYRVVCGLQLTDAFEVQSGVSQGCLLSSFLFLLAINWMLKTSAAQQGNRIQWTPPIPSYRWEKRPARVEDN